MMNNARQPLGCRQCGAVKFIHAFLPDGISPTVRLQTSAAFRKYLKDRVKVEFDGFDQSDGLIAEAKDEATGLIDECATLENIITVHGYGLKIESDAAHKDEVGLTILKWWEEQSPSAGEGQPPMPGMVLHWDKPVWVSDYIQNF